LINNLKPKEAVKEMDFAMKTLQRTSETSQSSFFGRTGVDLLGALIHTLGDEGLSISKHYLDSVLTTTDHTVANFLAVLESKVNSVSSRGHLRTNGASNFKSTLLIPFIALANRVRWNCDVEVASFSFWESGDGKGPIEVHFSYKNRKVESWIDSGLQLKTSQKLSLVMVIQTLALRTQP